LGTTTNAAAMVNTRWFSEETKEMGQTVVACPKCATKLKLQGDVAGKAVKCPKCSTAFRIGGGKKPASPAAPQKTPASPPGPPRAAKAAASTPTPKQASKSKPTTVSAAKSPSRKKARSAGSTADRPPAKKKRPSKRKPRREEVFDAAYDDDDILDASYDDDGAYDDYDDFGGGFDDGYGEPVKKSLPTRKKKKKKKSGGKSSKKKSSGGSLQGSLNALGPLGWILAGAAAGLVGIFLTTLSGLTNALVVISAMALVTGSMVGGAIRFAADRTQGWGPGIVAAVIGLAAIMAGKVGAFYVAVDIWGDSEWSVEDDIAYETQEGMMIQEVADNVQTEWLESGELKQEEVLAHAKALMAKYEAEDYEDGDYEEGLAETPIEEFAESYVPKVWDEALTQWNAKTPAEKKAAMDEKAAALREEWGSDADLEQTGRLIFAIIGAIASMFTGSGIVFFCMGVFSAFKLGSNLGTDE